MKVLKAVLGFSALLGVAMIAWITYICCAGLGDLFMGVATPIRDVGGFFYKNPKCFWIIIGVITITRPKI